jgi:hypothetical protein
VVSQEQGISRLGSHAPSFAPQTQTPHNKACPHTGFENSGTKVRFKRQKHHVSVRRTPVQDTAPDAAQDADCSPLTQFADQMPVPPPDGLLVHVPPLSYITEACCAFSKACAVTHASTEAKPPLAHRPSSSFSSSYLLLLNPASSFHAACALNVAALLPSAPQAQQMQVVGWRRSLAKHVRGFTGAGGSQASDGGVRHCVGDTAAPPGRSNGKGKGGGVWNGFVGGRGWHAGQRRGCVTRSLKWEEGAAYFGPPSPVAQMGKGGEGQGGNQDVHPE